MSENVEKIVWDGETSGALNAYKAVVEADKALMAQIRHTLDTADRGSKEWQQAKMKETQLLRQIAGDTKNLENATESLNKKQHETHEGLIHHLGHAKELLPALGLGFASVGSAGALAFKGIEAAIEGTAEQMKEFREHVLAARAELKNLAADVEVATLERSKETLELVPKIVQEARVSPEQAKALAVQLGQKQVPTEHIPELAGKMAGIEQGLQIPGLAMQLPDMLSAQHQPLNAESIDDLGKQYAAIRATISGAKLPNPETMRGSAAAYGAGRVAPGQALTMESILETSGQGGTFPKLEKSFAELGKKPDSDLQVQATRAIGLDPQHLSDASVPLLQKMKEIREAIKKTGTLTEEEFSVAFGKARMPFQLLLSNLDKVEAVEAAKPGAGQVLAGRIAGARTSPEAGKLRDEFEHKTEAAEHFEFPVEQFKQDYQRALMEKVPGHGPVAGFQRFWQTLGTKSVLGAGLTARLGRSGSMEEGLGELFTQAESQKDPILHRAAELMQRRVREREQGASALHAARGIQEGMPAPEPLARPSSSENEGVGESLREKITPPEVRRDQARAGEIKRLTLELDKEKHGLQRRKDALEENKPSKHKEGFQAVEEFEKNIHPIDTRLKEIARRQEDLQDEQKELKTPNITEGLPARRSGGSVRRGRPYRVGEAGEETFVPDQDGLILPHGSNNASASSAIDLTPLVEISREMVSLLREQTALLRNLGHRSILRQAQLT